MKKQFDQVKELLKKAKTVIIAAHVDPDGDAIGSMLALAGILEKLGKSVICYSADNFPKVYRFLPGADTIKREILNQQHFNMAFVLDSSNLGRVGDKVDLTEITKVIVNIDHHPDNTKFGEVNIVSNASSTGELVYELAKALQVKIDKPIAEALYTAIITDTGNFRYENTSVKTFEIAAELLKAGVDTHTLTGQIYDRKTIASIKILGLALSNLRFSPDKKIVWTGVNDQMLKETGAMGEDLVGIIDHLRAIDGIEVAVLFRRKENKCKVNFRSKDKANVSLIAKSLGGGGHVKAAGATIEGDCHDVVERVITAIQKHL
ncbi:MAG: bifunctional oligoribonuclease/PAP phosphatase NrnA [bacterium]